MTSQFEVRQEHIGMNRKDHTCHNPAVAIHTLFGLLSLLLLSHPPRHQLPMVLLNIKKQKRMKIISLLLGLLAVAFVQANEANKNLLEACMADRGHDFVSDVKAALEDVSLPPFFFKVKE